MICWISVGSTPVVVVVTMPDASGACLAGTTILPACPGGAWWMCIAVAGSAIPATTTSNVTELFDGSTVIAAKPVPAGSPGGTSTVPLIDATRQIGPLAMLLPADPPVEE